MASGAIQDGLPPITARRGLEGLVADIGDFQIASSVIDRDYFARGWFSEPELKVISGLEKLAQDVLRELGPRDFSGLHQYSHVDRSLEASFKLAKQAGVSLDFITVLAIIGHDAIEGNKEVRESYDKWKQALLSGENYETLRGIATQLKAKREEKRDEIKRYLYSCISQEVNGGDRADLRGRIDAAVRIMYQVTRFPDELPYALSMNFQFSRVSNENVENMLRRMVAKNGDIASNNGEFGHLYSPATMRQIATAFEPQTTVSELELGNELAMRFGSVREPREMPAAVRVGHAFNTLFALYFQNRAHNGYDKGIRSGNYGESAKELLSLAEVSKRIVIDATIGLLQSAIRIYESDAEIQKVKQQVDGMIKGYRAGTFYYGITPDGFSRELLVRDAGGRSIVADLDKSPEGRQRAYIYARHLLEVISMCSKFYERGNVDELGRPKLIDDTNVPYNPEKHAWFTMSGVEEMLKDSNLKGIGFWDLVRRTARQYSSMENGGHASPHPL